jgi:deoxyribodipyrimidine photo-lyase
MTVVWFRRALRLADHAALTFAADRGPVTPVWIWAPGEEAPHETGGAQRWWLSRSLPALDASLRAVGSRLTLRHGPSAEALIDVARAVGADTVAWESDETPHLNARDADVRRVLEAAGLRVRVFGGRILHEPDAVQTGGGLPYRVFTPFWKRVRDTVDVPAPTPSPATLAAPNAWPASETLDAFPLTAEQQDGVDWSAGMDAAWTPGEAGALSRLDAFACGGLDGYGEGRDAPAAPHVSRLSPHLHFGEVSIRQAWHGVGGGPAADVAKFRAELGWREFAYHVLHHRPDTTHAPMNAAFEAFPWRDDPAGLAAWQRGRTGIPIVDAGMRELWATGWMHNRVRMLVASFLVKDLFVPWTVGAAWFSDTLVDHDLASNTLGWQWVAGSGADAQPFFRIFNPVSQGERFDADGAYVRRWVPEIAGLPDAVVHRPWEATPLDLAAAGVTLGETYPAPIVDHAARRVEALAALDQMRADSKSQGTLKTGRM